MATVGLNFSVSNDTAASLKSVTCQSQINHLIDTLAALSAGMKTGRIILSLDDGTSLVQASNTITITNANIVDTTTTLTIGGVVLTAKTTGATGPQFNIGTDATATGVNVVACIIANVPGITATSAAGVVTVTSLVPGVIGNRVTLATATAGAFAFGASTGALLGGAGLAAAPRTFRIGA